MRTLVWADSLAINLMLAVHLYLISCDAPLTAEPAPGQSGQLGTLEAPSKETIPCS